MSKDNDQAETIPGKGGLFAWWKTKRHSKVGEYVEAIVLALVLALFIRTFVVQAFKIPSPSMVPTLLVGDHILVSKFIYGYDIPFMDSRVLAFEKPHRGDIIVFKYPKNPRIDFIKRCVAVGGDTVEMRKKKLFVNGKMVPDVHARYFDSSPSGFMEGRDNFGPVTVPEGKLFMMGDNRDNSNDSRFWGFVPLKNVRGKAFMIYWSWDKSRSLPRIGRMGELLK